MKRAYMGTCWSWLVAILLIALGGRMGLAAEASPGDATNVKVDDESAGAPGRQIMVPTNVLDMLHKGGPVMWILVACSIILLAFVFERLAALRPSRVIPKPFVERFLQQVRDGDLDRERALAVCEDSPSPIAEVFSGAARKWGRPAVEVEQAIIDGAERATYGLRRYLRVFTALAVIGPLLGLLGTVIGMIHAFNAVASEAAHGSAVSEQLALGISEALLNTAAGLVLAIPAQSLYLYFVSRVDRLVIEMDRLGQKLVQMISAEEIQARGEARTRRPPRRDAPAGLKKDDE